MLLKSALAVSIFAVSIGSYASSIDNHYIIKAEALGVSEKQDNSSNASCLTIKKNKSSSKSGVYEISVNGVKLKTYCEMTIDGGGWTQVMVRHHSVNAFEFDNNIGERQLVPGRSYSVDDAVWGSLSSSSTHLMMYYDGGSYAYIKIEKTKNARCEPLTSTLKRPILWHDETSGCNWTGLDYSGGGWDTPNAFGFYEFNNGYFDKVVGIDWNNTANRGGMLFIR